MAEGAALWGLCGASLRELKTALLGLEERPAMRDFMPQAKRSLSEALIKAEGRSSSDPSSPSATPWQGAAINIGEESVPCYRQ